MAGSLTRMAGPILPSGCLRPSRLRPQQFRAGPGPAGRSSGQRSRGGTAAGGAPHCRKNCPSESPWRSRSMRFRGGSLGSLPAMIRVCFGLFRVYSESIPSLLRSIPSCFVKYYTTAELFLWILHDRRRGASGRAWMGRIGCGCKETRRQEDRPGREPEAERGGSRRRTGGRAVRPTGGARGGRGRQCAGAAERTRADGYSARTDRAARAAATLCCVEEGNAVCGTIPTLFLVLNGRSVFNGNNIPVMNTM